VAGLEVSISEQARLEKLESSMVAVTSAARWGA
jgi:hypothetical protein